MLNQYGVEPTAQKAAIIRSPPERTLGLYRESS